MKKRIFGFILAVIMAVSCFTFASCKDNTSVIDEKPGEGALTTKSLTNIYSAEAVSLLDTALENIEIGSIMPFSDDKLLVTGYDTKSYDQKYFITDITFKDAKEIKLTKASDENSDEYVNSFAADTENGVIWYVKNTYYHNAGAEYPIANDDIAVPFATNLVIDRVDAATIVTTEAVTEAVTEVEYVAPTEVKTLVKMDENGEILVQNDIGELLMVEQEDGSSYSGWISNMFVNGNSLFLLVDGGKVCVIDTATSQLTKEFKIEGVDYIDRFFADSNGKLYYTFYGENGMQINEYDMDSGKSTEFNFPIEGESFYNYNILPGDGGYDIILTDDSACYGYNAGDEDITEICNYANSDLDVSYGVRPAFLEDGRLLISYYDYNEGENVLLILTKVPPEQVKEKYLITVATGSYLNREIKSAFMKFNRTNDTYKIVFKDYSEYNNESNEWTGANAKLAEDIINGAAGAADIVVFDSYFDYESLSSKGALVDLNNYIESDESFVREEFLSNIFEALESSGKLYMLTPTVNFQTMVVSKSFAAGRTSWTMKDFIDAHNSLSDGEQLISEATRDGVGNMLLQIVLDEFIDENTGRCNFNSEEFKSLLMYLKDIPADYTAYEDMWQENENYWLDQEMSYSKGTTKVFPAYISNFDMIPELEGRFGEEVVLIGYPTNDAESSGTIITPDSFIAINSSSKVKAGAWEAIKHLLADENQNKYAGSVDENGSANSSYRFPVKTSMVEKKKENDLLPEFWVYTDENGEEVREEYGNTMWLGESEIELRKSTDADVDEVYRAIKGAKTAFLSKEALVDIINQEAEGFYSGEKSVDEVADIINSRVQIYVSERM